MAPLIKASAPLKLPSTHCLSLLASARRGPTKLRKYTKLRKILFRIFAKIRSFVGMSDEQK